jgi:hypothetical protein
MPTVILKISSSTRPAESDHPEFTRWIEAKSQQTSALGHTGPWLAIIATGRCHTRATSSTARDLA